MGRYLARSAGFEAKEASVGSGAMIFFTVVMAVVGWFWVKTRRARKGKLNTYVGS